MINRETFINNQPEQEEVPLIGVNIPDKLVYVNGNLQVIFSDPEIDLPWKIFTTLIKDYKKGVGEYKLLREVQNKSELESLLQELNTVLTPDKYTDIIIEKKTNEQTQTSSYCLNAKIAIVKL